MVHQPVNMSPPRDIYYAFSRAKNYLFNDYAYYDGVRFFDVIAQSNPKFWQSVGEQSPIQPSTSLPINVTALVTLERVYKEPSIVKFIELIEELKEHVAYTSKVLSIHGKDDAAEAKLANVIANEMRQAFSKFKIDDLIQINNDGKMYSRLLESDDVNYQSKMLSMSYRSEILGQYENAILQNQKNRHGWWRSKMSVTLKFPLVDVGTEWERKS